MQGNRLHKSTLEARLVKKIRKLIPTGVRFDQFQVVGIRYNMGTIQAQFAGEALEDVGFRDGIGAGAKGLPHGEVVVIVLACHVVRPISLLPY